MYSITRNFTFFMRNFISRSNISTTHFALHQISTNYFASHFHKLFCFVKIHDALSTTKLTNDSKQESLASRNQNHSRNFLAAQKRTHLFDSVDVSCILIQVNPINQYDKNPCKKMLQLRSLNRHCKNG